jgi:beta-glucanase (GH16 family)
MVREMKYYCTPGFVLLASLVVLLRGVYVENSARPVDAPAWKLFWSDEFDGTGGVDPSKWLCDIGISYPGGPANWGTGELEAYICSLDNVFLEAGYLHIRVLHSGADPLKSWTSGRIETVRTDFQPPVGGAMAVEARIQLPNLNGVSAQGYWPAFWMLGAPYRGNYMNWPGVGEIDIMENINGLNQWWGTFHCGTNPGGQCNEPSGAGGTSTGFLPSLQEGFHTYRMEFDKSVTPQQLRWYVDGVQRFIVSSDQVDAATWNDATNHGFFILLNVAIGGGWAGNPTASTASGGTMLMDYVHVYAWPIRSVYLPLITR